MEGWIKIHRHIKDHWIWKSDHRLKWWLDILLTVNHADTKILIKGSLIDCKRGQSVRSLETWGKDWNVTKKTVKEFFELLQKDSMLVYESIQISTRITVCNYDNYQTEVNGAETKGKRKVNGAETETTPKQECKEGIKNDNNENNNTWRTDFQIYISECQDAYRLFWKDMDLLKTQQRLNPGVNVKLSIEKGYVNFWGTEAGWKHKKKSRSNEIDWKTTIINSIDLNKVYFTKEQLNNPEKITINQTTLKANQI